MRSRIAGCSRMTWFVIGSFRAFTTIASSRSTRNWMSMSGGTIPDEEQRLFPEYALARDLGRRWEHGAMLPHRARDDQAAPRERRMREDGLVPGDVRERRIAEGDVGRDPAVEVRERV